MNVAMFMGGAGLRIPLRLSLSGHRRPVGLTKISPADLTTAPPSAMTRSETRLQKRRTRPASLPLGESSAEFSEANEIG
ncbi:hypothetical protein AFA91_23180 [Mycolicibacterium goodii]|uniref:Uncharacterized protein n=1 Tax=Mycolicibacterium goodii TaxID=134601 RepID=A0A0K0XA61_MYCGD|nr:hypothetical protein AFA91_23180 [Mycolicibacterium goodii]